MDELEMQNKKAELIARIPHLDPIHSPNYDDVMAQMDILRGWMMFWRYVTLPIMILKELIMTSVFTTLPVR